jgi:hypothetical protein
MAAPGYEVVPYHHEFLDQVIDILAFLHGSDRELNSSFFHWKYYENPFTDSPMGVVVLHQGRVVACRFACPYPWEIRDRDFRFPVLDHLDAAVHVDHRRRGLATAMWKKIVEEFSGDCPLQMASTSSAEGLPGYLKVNFLPLADRTHLSLYSLTGAMRYLVRAGERSGLRQGRVEFGRFGDIEVSDSPVPADMNGVEGRQDTDGDRIRLVQDEAFFRWRFRNPKRKYAFYYHRRGDALIGFATVMVSPNNRRAYILDYAWNDLNSFGEIMAHILREKHFDVISICEISLSGDHRRMLLDQGFRRTGLIRRVDARRWGKVPFLIRPSKMDYREEDLLVGGLDASRIENWHIKGIILEAF